MPIETTRADVAFRNATYKRLKISEVNSRNFFIEAIDQYGSPYRIEWSTQPGIVVVPRVGEDWIATRIDNLWKLVWRFENRTESTLIESLHEGDIRIEGASVFLNYNNLFVNGFRFEHKRTVYNEIPNGLIDGTNILFTTSKAFIEGTLRVYHNGLRTVEYELLNNVGFEMDVAPETEDTLLVDYDYNPLNDISESQLDEMDVL